MFIELITKRRSIRRYDKRPVEKEKIDLLIETALRSPSSRGFNPWEFIVVNDPSLIEKLSKAKPHGSSFLKNAPLGIVICADPQISDVWIEDAAIASIYLHLAATSLELGSCWIQIRDRMHDETRTAHDYIAELIGIPENLNVLSIMAIGYPAEKRAPLTRRELQYEKVSFNQYGIRSM